MVVREADRLPWLGVPGGGSWGSGGPPPSPQSGTPLLWPVASAWSDPVFPPPPLLSAHPRVSPCLPNAPCVSLSGRRAPSLPSAPSSGSSAKGGGGPWPGGAQTCSPGPACRYRSLAQPAPAARLSSVSSHDSGFVSQEATYSKPPSPMPSDITSQVRGVC